jgi:hypothetical protein
MMLWDGICVAICKLVVSSLQMLGSGAICELVSLPEYVSLDNDSSVSSNNVSLRESFDYYNRYVVLRKVF